MTSVGNTGSQAVAIAKDLIHLCGTKVLHGQDAQVSDDLAELIGLKPMAHRLVTDWATAGKGRAIWVVGNQTFKVQTIRAERELQLTDTNQALHTLPDTAEPDRWIGAS